MLFIFDWDGTVCDSTGKIVLCMQRAANDIGIEVLEPDVIKNIIGLGLPEALVTLYPHLDVEKQSQLTASYSSHFLKDDVSNPTQLFEGALDTLKQLKENGFKLAVATGKSRRGLNRVLEQLDLSNFFDATRCADETESKPHPKMLQELLVEFNVDSRRSVMIGDTEYDMEMAERIGMPRIAVSYGAHHIDRLVKYDPILCIDHFSQIENFKFSKS